MALTCQVYCRVYLPGKRVPGRLGSLPDSLRLLTGQGQACLPGRNTSSWQVVLPVLIRAELEGPTTNN